MSRLAISSLAVVIVSLAGNLAQCALVTQTFDSASSAAAAGWAQAGTPLSFSNANTTLGTSGAGEGGGKIPLPTLGTAARAYYADTTGISLDLSKTFASAGEVSIVSHGTSRLDQGGVFYFDSTIAEVGKNSVGFELIDSGAGQQRITPAIYLADGTRKAGGQTIISHGAYTYDFAWDPVLRNLSFNLYSGVTTISSLNLTLSLAEVANFGSLNAFGVGSTTFFGSSNSNVWVEAYIDNVSYETGLAAVPEPSAIILTFSGACALYWVRRKK
jgi:hypothetical protein